MTLALFTPSAAFAERKADAISARQLERLAAEAQTPADHTRIAQYYEAKAQEYIAQAHLHEAMIENFKADPTRINNKNQASTIGHCQYFVYNYKALAAKSERMAQMHEQMAFAVTPPVPASAAPAATTSNDMPGMDMGSGKMDCCCHGHK